MTTTEHEKPTETQGVVGHDYNPDADVSKLRAGMDFALRLTCKEDGSTPYLDMTEGDMPPEVVVDVLVSVSHHLMHRVGEGEFRAKTEEFISHLGEHKTVPRSSALMLMTQMLIEGTDDDPARGMIPDHLRSLLGRMPPRPTGAVPTSELPGQYV